MSGKPSRRGRGRGQGQGQRQDQRQGQGQQGQGHQSPSPQVLLVSVVSQTHSNNLGPTAVDPCVTGIEDAIVKASTSAAFAKMSIDGKHPERPNYGKQGTPIVLRANYFELDLGPGLILYRYDWSVKDTTKEEKEEGKKEKKAQTLEGKKLGRVIQLCLQSPELAKFQQDMVTDFRSILIARRDMPDQEITVAYRPEGEGEPRQRGTQYTMLLKKSAKESKTLHADDLTRYLVSKDPNAQYESKSDAVQALNILINHYAKSSPAITTIGTSRSFALADPEDYDLGAGLKAMRGYFTSVRAATARMLLNVNVSHAAFYTDGPLDNLLTILLKCSTIYHVDRFLNKLRIHVTHLKTTNKKVKTIIGIAKEGDGKGLEHAPKFNIPKGAGSKEVHFWLNKTGQGKPSPAPKKKASDKSTGGEYTSVHKYFKDTYGITITNPDLPVINVGTQQDPSYLPAQVCRVIPGQRANCHLSGDQTTHMINFAVRGPEDNSKSIVSKGLSTAGISNNTSSHMGQFGVKIKPGLIAVHGRVLCEPSVLYAQKKRATVNGGSWNMVPRQGNLQFAVKGILWNWSMLFVDVEGYRKQEYTTIIANELTTKLLNVLRDTGIDIKGQRLPPDLVRLQGPDDPELEKRIEDAARKMRLLFVVLPATQMPLYNRLKYLADVKYGIHTICSVRSKMTAKGQDQYLRNEALKANLKLGGQNHSVQSEGLKLISENKTMIVGIDVTHPSPGSSPNAPSISAMVASVDSQLNQWPGTLRVQSTKREEMVSDLKEMLKSRLTLWSSKRQPRTYPENILVYRDGVSEGQYSAVLDNELPQLREACKEIYPAIDQAKGIPRMTLVIVGKRHHTRFYTTNAADTDKSGNPKSGTVVDRGVTEARNWDFFLQSHAAIKGTARPAHYFVLIDEIFRQFCGKKKNVADELQMTTQSLCYTFGRATKAVSYCAPAYLADILCERGRCYYYKLYDGSTDDATSVDGGARSNADANAPSLSEISIHERLKDSMFYI
ncbi:ribonuclease H-like domain-containing protein [Xylaria telfairii]|nr:ribonuclease H-like domain-containing protein [Xylaria telfairii]